MDGDINKLIKLAGSFRSAIVESDPELLVVDLQNFPYGACGNASLLLAKYLENNECGKFDYILGKREGKSHAWLQNGSLIVDITADQFQDQNKTVIVTMNHCWHSSFNVINKHIADFLIYDENTISELSATFEQILRHI